MKNPIFRTALACTVLASAVVFTGCQQEELLENQFPTAVATETVVHGQVIEGQYIVVLKEEASPLPLSDTNISLTRQAAVAANAGIGQEAIRKTFRGAVSGFAARLSAEQLKTLRNNPEVAYVEQDRMLTLGKSEMDTGLNRNNNEKGKGKKKGVNKPKKSDGDPTTDPATSTDGAYTKITPLAGELVPWNIALVGYGDGTGKTVWLIDSGVDTDHPDLTVDLSRSMSFVEHISSVEDGYGHGTTVAGIIAARNNGSGMIGVAAGATVVALRIFDDNGVGTLSGTIAAVGHVVDFGKAGDVVNMSISTAISYTLDYLVKSAASRGINFAVAAGNGGVDCISIYPAAVDAPGVYTVSAMDSYGRMWEWSNYGLSVDFSAPGVDVTTTTTGGTIGNGAYGTSFAAPHVAGVLLLRGKVYAKGAITGDKDAVPDPIASLE
ncbi:S8 family serine peptidase [Botryobacter ruber]|uniref:S8 family serine peptidase n=1 Tax=Botryobacter ruber TaxID=2171629 RepID=UPI000E0CA227|nr:S8 family serine peptidase [Botryobacter ruber]